MGILSVCVKEKYYLLEIFKNYIIIKNNVHSKLLYNKNISVQLWGNKRLCK